MKERYHTREIVDIGGGMLQTMPRMGVILTYISIASLGLPGLAGFPGEFTALLASFSPAPGLVDAGHLLLFRVLMVLGAVGTLLTAGYFLWMLQRVNMGHAPSRWKDAALADVSVIEWGTWTPLLLMTLLLGILPFLIWGITTPDVNGLLRAFGA
jgi:NADH-quinone oxidoreductase subunit M